MSCCHRWRIIQWQNKVVWSILFFNHRKINNSMFTQYVDRKSNDIKTLNIYPSSNLFKCQMKLKRNLHSNFIFVDNSVKKALYFSIL